MRAIADNNFDATEMMEFVSTTVENIAGKGENAFLIFQMF